MKMGNPLLLLDAVFGPIGRWAMLLVRAFSTPGEYRRYRYSLGRQMIDIGLASLPIVLLSAGFTGAVSTVQADHQMDNPFIPRRGLGIFVTASIVLETAALITAFILAGRIGARIAAELASMRVGEQIDAMDVMGINSAGFLIVPRVVAGTIVMPMLYVGASAVAILVAIMISTSRDVATFEIYMKGAREWFTTYNAFYGGVKAVVFGFLLTSISCYKGYFASGGAEGIGRSATEAAVVSIVYVLAADYFLAEVML